jgi:hypothetical protein
MLQIFYLDISKVDWDVTRCWWLTDSDLPQPPFAAAGGA